SLLPTLADQQEKVKITVQEYVDAWRQKQADLRPLTVVRLAGTAMVYLFNGILLPNDYGGNLCVSEDGRSIENGPEHSELSLIYDHYEQGTRVYQDTNGDFVTIPANSDGTDQSTITLRRAKQQVAGTFSSSSNLPTNEENVILP
ncbi:hypothetical protein FOL47_001424, partial [Perkinsus chesapeaki]